MQVLAILTVGIILAATQPTGLAAETDTYHLAIFPAETTQKKSVGSHVLFTCKPEVDRAELITELRWLDPKGLPILASQPRTGIKTEFWTNGNLALIFKSLQPDQAGDYTCEANYARSEKLTRTVNLQTFVAITWVDAPEVQSPILHKRFKIRCKVTAQPAPSVDWMKNGEIIRTDDHVVTDNDGLILLRPTEADDGIYTCRAIVVETGELAERNIKVEVNTPPKIAELPPEIEWVEGEPASIQCYAEAKPPPEFKWIKTEKGENLETKDRFGVRATTGLLDVSRVKAEDDGVYRCEASNTAGTNQTTVRVTVVIKPRIVTLKNITIPLTTEAVLECSASGRPPPLVTFRKLTNPGSFLSGVQPGDDRVTIETRLDKERQETIASLRINDLNRADDGIYECIASNKGGVAKKNGHLTVEFKPSFAAAPKLDVWTWDRNPVNLTCLAEAIPNATYTWKLNNFEIRQEKDIQIKQTLEGPKSILTVNPTDHRFYGRYLCKATNKHGFAEHSIELKKASRPGNVLQANMVVVTATTITFGFIGPADHGGMPLRSYAVQYIEQSKSWNEANNKTWTIDSPYILEGLEPQKTYYFRFAAQNDVGYSDWSLNVQRTMPKRSNPEEPVILRGRLTDPTEVAVSPYPDRLQLSWNAPADNGEPIDHYELKFCRVHRSGEGSWIELESGCHTLNVQSTEHTGQEFNDLDADSHYRVELRAHNSIGYSTPAQVVIKTARDPRQTGSDSLVLRKRQEPTLGSMTIIGIVVGSLLVILVIVDVSCFIFNRAGILALLCGSKAGGRKRTQSEEDAVNLGSEEKEPLKEPGKIIPLHEPMRRQMSVEFDGKRSISRSSFVGKDSAV